MGRTYLTREGYEKLRKDVDALKEQKRELSKMIGEAREQGDLRENAGYQYAKEKQAEVMRRISDIETKLGSAQLIDDAKIAKDEVRIGATVTMKELSSGAEMTYTFVGQEESDPSAGKLSVHSPLGEGFLGHKSGETVEITLPAGKKQFKILKIGR
ncbi:MAG: transcription elongation factor GreA [Elusimicrobia bacterium RIFCSPLOWO2_01_FULL_60_11]|nr:MAG: transcription elongation factor GreA [Elusimicrobia bacterium RIFCSPLOWO2_01_FULL_60_11]